MNADRFNQLVRQAEVRKLELRVNKGEEYTRGAPDVLANFKRVAEGTGLTPLQVWYVYFAKHIDAIANYIRTGKEASNEPIFGRIDDSQVYLDLLRGLVTEHQEARLTGMLQIENIPKEKPLQEQNS